MSGKRSILRISGLSCFVFIVSLIASSLAFSYVLPPRDIYASMIARARKPADIILLGSSFTAIDLLPEVIEEELSQGGFKMEVSNLALYGARGFETEYFIRQIEPTLRSARIVIIDFRDWNLDTVYGGFLSRRGIQWHDFVSYSRILKACIRHGEKDLILIRDHTLAFILHYLPLGRAFRESMSDPVAMIQSSDESGGVFEAGGVSYEQMLEATRTLRNLPDTHITDPIEVESLLTRLEATGVTVFVFLPPAPTAINWSTVEAVREVSPHVKFLNFDSEILYPELYRRENRWDYSHLNRKGATTCSRLVARQLVAHMKKNNEPPNPRN